MLINGFSSLNPAYATDASRQPGKSVDAAPMAADPAARNQAAGGAQSTDAAQVVAPVQRAGEAVSSQALDQELIEQQRLVEQLARRDREVRQHEMAHQAVGGRYTGAVSYVFERGPDGQLYAVGGEVSIDTSPVPGDARATLEKAETVVRAAMAPADPSPQDARVAADARAMAAAARVELARERTEELQPEEGVEASAEQTRSDLVVDAQSQTDDQLAMLAELQARREAVAEAARAENDELARLEEEAAVQRERREEITERVREQREKTAEKLREFALELAEIQAAVQELNQRLIATGALSKLNEPGSILDSQI